MCRDGLESGKGGGHSRGPSLEQSGQELMVAWTSMVTVELKQRGRIQEYTRYSLERDRERPKWREKRGWVQNVLEVPAGAIK